jgi:excisionase family DNA binding protein
MATRYESATTENASTYPSVAALAADIGLSERSTRNALRRGEIPHLRIGRRFILPKAAIAEWLRSAGRDRRNAAATPSNDVAPQGWAKPPVQYIRDVSTN